ncbi:MAG: SBBP repeat-containing protein [Byssovorax sp.]
MSRRVHTATVAALSLAITLGAAVSGGGCALMFDYSDYTAAGTGGAGGGDATTSSSGTTGAGGGTQPDHLWSKRFGDTDLDVVGYPGLDLDPTGDAVFITGAFGGKIDLGNNTDPLTSSKFGFFLARLDAKTGLPSWSRSVANTTSTVPSLAATADGGVVVAGSFDITATIAGATAASAGLHDVFVARYDGGGAQQWAHRFGDPSDQLVSAVAVDPSGNVYLTGEFQGQLDLGPGCSSMSAVMSGFNNGFVARLSSAGDCLWLEKFGDHAYGSSLSADADGVTLGGAITGPTTFGGTTIGSATKGSFVARYNLMGVSTFATIVPGQEVQVVNDPVSHQVFFGTTAPGMGVGDVKVGELDPQGDPLWLKSYSGTGSIHLASITRTVGGDLVISGDATGDIDFGAPLAVNHGFQDMFVARLSAAGATLGCVELGDAKPQFGRNVRVDKQGYAYLYGDFQGSIDFGAGNLTTAGNFDVAVARLKLP